MPTQREPTAREMQRLGAADGRALARALALSVRGALTQRHVDQMLQVVERGIRRMAEELAAGGLSEDLVRAYGRACSEAIVHEMASLARAGRMPVTTASHSGPA